LECKALRPRDGKLYECETGIMPHFFPREWENSRFDIYEIGKSLLKEMD
jgi:hypothetical protein